MDKEKKRIERVRKRVTYIGFMKWYRFLKTKPTVFSILWRLHKFLDGKSCYRSETQSNYAEESLRQLIKDKNGNLDCEHSFVDVDNEGSFGKEQCRFCEVVQKKR